MRSLAVSRFSIKVGVNQNHLFFHIINFKVKLQRSYKYLEVFTVDRQLCRGQTTQQSFRAVVMSSRKMRKRLSCPFVRNRVVKRKKRDCFARD